MRISSVKEREPVRVSKQAIADGMTFSHIGSEMINAYRKRKEVEAVQIYFLTSKTADYELLYDKAHRIEQITDSLNHMFNGLVMDCSACKSRELCDEIDGMKELHRIFHPSDRAWLSLLFTLILFLYMMESTALKQLSIPLSSIAPYPVATEYG